MLLLGEIQDESKKIQRGESKVIRMGSQFNASTQAGIF